MQIYCRRKSNGALALARLLNCKVVKKPTKEELICWGYGFTRGLNCKPVGNKLRELQKLTEAKVRVPKISLEPLEGYLPRSKHHKSGKDLLNPPDRPDFYVEKLEITQEFRVHVVGGKSIRIGIKVPSSDAAHPWIRCHSTGWRFDYGHVRERLPKGVRSAAKKAVEALGYDFGAVDVAVVGGKAYVLEVNAAPGLDNEHTAEAYARHLPGLFDE